MPRGGGPATVHAQPEDALETPAQATIKAPEIPNTTQQPTPKIHPTHQDPSTPATPPKKVPDAIAVAPFPHPVVSAVAIAPEPRLIRPMVPMPDLEIPRPTVAVAPYPHPKPYKSDRPSREIFAGYYLRTPHGFRVYVSQLAYERSDELEGEPLKVIDEQLARIVKIVPELCLRAMRKVPIWVEWDHAIPKEVRAYAVYYGVSGHMLWKEGIDARKADSVCVLSLKVAHHLRVKEKKQQNVLLHEFAHAIHDKLFEFDNPFISNAFEQAVARKLYENVKHDDGTERKADARTNVAEYFAELSCAYLFELDYYPHNRNELKEYDSVGYELMTKAYGKPELLAKKKNKKP